VRKYQVKLDFGSKIISGQMTATAGEYATDEEYEDFWRQLSEALSLNLVFDDGRIVVIPKACMSNLLFMDVKEVPNG